MKLLQSLVQCCVLVLVLFSGELFGTATALVQAQHHETTAVQWRRTVDGWERADLWEIQPRAHDLPESEGLANTRPAPLPGFHPVFVASLMFAAAGLLAIGRDP